MRALSFPPLQLRKTGFRFPTLPRRFGCGSLGRDSIVTQLPIESALSDVEDLGSLPAIAARWITAFVEPPMAISTLMAFSKAERVMTREGRRSCVIISTIWRPLASASW